MQRKNGILTLIVVLVAACGPLDEGSWLPPPIDPPVVESATLPINAEDVTMPAPIRPIPRPFDVRCTIPSLDLYPKLLEPNASFPIHGSLAGERICLGEGALGLDFCYFVRAMEQRHRAVAACFKKALEKLDSWGLDAYEGDAELWREARASVVPAAWNVDPAQATADVGLMSGWVAAMMSGLGDKSAISAEPFCFTKQRDEPLRAAKPQVLGSLWVLWKWREAQVKSALGTLRRGLDTTLAADRRPVQLTVEVVETKQQVKPQGSCYFELAE